jgi:hypothetical protein
MTTPPPEPDPELSTSEIDATWRGPALNTRAALNFLGLTMPACLPGEEEECDGGYAEHTATNLGALRAVVANHIDHLGPDATTLVEAGERNAAEDLARIAGHPASDHD